MPGDNPLAWLFGNMYTPAERSNTSGDNYIRGGANAAVDRAASANPTLDIPMPRMLPQPYVRAIANQGRANARNDAMTRRYGPFAGAASMAGADAGMGPLPREAGALLDVISQFEGTADKPNGGYNTLVGGSQISDLSRHPNVVGVTTVDGPSRAFGRYQFIPGTWGQAQRALNLQDMSNDSQDRAAWWLAQQAYKRSTGRELIDDVAVGSRWPAIAQALGSQWASFPGQLGRNQRQHSVEQFAQALSDRLNNAIQSSPRTPGEFIGTDSGRRSMTGFVRARQGPPA